MMKFGEIALSASVSDSLKPVELRSAKISPRTFSAIEVTENLMVLISLRISGGVPGWAKTRSS